MGFGYSDWAGGFYPDGLKSADYLAHYSSHFDSVELDTTFHAAPTLKTVQRWAAVTPPSFRFAAKTPRAITHELSPEHAIEPMRAFLDVMRELSEKLGVVLLQFPPSFHLQKLKQLDKLLSSLPTDIRYAVEFRNQSWYTASAEKVLHAHRCSFVVEDYENAALPIIPTTDFLYVRWLGTHGQFDDMKTQRVSVTKRLAWWKKQIEEHFPTGTVWGFFNNDYSGNAIEACTEFREMLGMKPLTKQSREPTLFG